MGYKKVDANQKEIVEALRSIGASVQSIASIGKGCPDLLVGFRKGNYLFEVKVKNERYTVDECLWDYNWRGTCYRVSTPEDALRILGARQ